MCVCTLPPPRLPPLPPARPRRACARGRECACVRASPALSAPSAHTQNSCPVGSYRTWVLGRELGAVPSCRLCSRQARWQLGPVPRPVMGGLSVGGGGWDCVPCSLGGLWFLCFMGESNLSFYKGQSGQKYFMEFFNTEFKKRILLDTHTVRARSA